MALTDAQQRVFGLSREELPKAEWTDQYLLDTFVQMLIGFIEKEDGLVDHQRVLLKAFQDRFNWLSGLAEVNGYGPEPGLFVNGSTEINVNWIKYWARQRGVDITEAALQAVHFATTNIERMQLRIEELRVIAGSTRYEAAEDEPSIFGGERNSPGTDWMLWYSRRNEVSLIVAFEAGQKIMEQLMTELPRFVGGDTREPEMSVQSKELEKAGVKHRALSMNWVIYAKYYRELDWYETHSDGLILMRKRS